ncbi:GNAT family N-acetyltransferase [Virgibacillus kekensis]|uniref:GNAT family N-acetyltransferase n=1 Tax=Virgibacillus kekensis TaxID=202261 RepID=A0ABV9DJN2_9BACI
MEFFTNKLELLACDQERFIHYSESYTMGPHIEKYLEKLNEDPLEEGWGVWFIILKETREVVGDIGFKGSPDLKGNVEIGYGVSPMHQGKGYATEAVAGIIYWAFETGAVKQITAECLNDNFASIRVLEKTGMQRTCFDGDMLYWSLDAADWAD